jgi:hypothetical protein
MRRALRAASSSLPLSSRARSRSLAALSPASSWIDNPSVVVSIWRAMSAPMPSSNSTVNRCAGRNEIGFSGFRSTSSSETSTVTTLTEARRSIFCRAALVTPATISLIRLAEPAVAPSERVAVAASSAIVDASAAVL